MDPLTLGAIGVLLFVLFVFKPKPKATAAATTVAPPPANPAMFLDTLNGGTPGAYSKIDAACEDYAVGQKLSHLFKATSHLMPKDSPPATPATVPNPPQSPAA